VLRIYELIDFHHITETERQKINAHIKLEESKKKMDIERYDSKLFSKAFVSKLTTYLAKWNLKNKAKEKAAAGQD